MIGYDLCPPVLCRPALMEWVGLGVVRSHPGQSCLPLRTFHAWVVGTSPGFCLFVFFFHLPQGEKMEGGREDKF